MRKGRVVDGILVLDKPVGISSNQALQQVKRLFEAKKAGHTGSLDVLASGLLPICFGQATKFSQYLLNADKTYCVSAQLGVRTETCDAEGAVVEERSIAHITRKEIDTVLQQFLGKSMQVPSMYSALKHQGQTLYKLARQGITVERKPRPIAIYALELIDWQENQIHLTVRCSKGTYIRNLVDDIGQKLHCGAYVTDLRRTAAGAYTAQDMVTLETLEALKAEGGLPALDQRLLPIASALAHLPILNLNPEQARKLQHGQRVYSYAILQGDVRLMVDKIFLGVGSIAEDGKILSQRLMS